jgi:hypothetical protein
MHLLVAGASDWGDVTKATYNSSSAIRCCTVRSVRRRGQLFSRCRARFSSSRVRRSSSGVRCSSSSGRWAGWPRSPAIPSDQRPRRRGDRGPARRARRGPPLRHTRHVDHDQPAGGHFPGAAVGWRGDPMHVATFGAGVGVRPVVDRCRDQNRRANVTGRPTATIAGTICHTETRFLGPDRHNHMTSRFFTPGSSAACANSRIPSATFA